MAGKGGRAEAGRGPCIDRRSDRASLNGGALKLSASNPAIALAGVPVPARRHHGRRPALPAVQLSYRDVEELLIECGVEVDHVTVFRWVQRFAPRLADAAPIRVSSAWRQLVHR